MTAKKFVTKYLFVASLVLLCSAVYANASETRIETSLSDGGKATIFFSDSPLKTMTEIPFAIVLKSNSGEGIKSAELELDLTMPFMPMPPNTPKASWQEEAYRGTAIFTMAGAWQVNVDINYPNGTETEKIIFDIEMVVMK